jgi:DNA-binding transcriptional LysR family regulator
MKMKINQMKAFHELMLTRSVSETARNLGRSQPSISATIAAIESDLGMKLFERRGGRLHPVPEAQYLKEECGELLGRIDTLRQNMRGIQMLDSGRLEIVTMQGPAVSLLPNLIAGFAAGKPNIACELISRSSNAVFQLVSAQQYDLGIADYFEGRAENTTLVTERAYAFDLLCAMSKDDPMGRYEVITPKDLQDKPIATLNRQHGVFSDVEKAFSSYNLVPNIRFGAQYFIPLLTFAKRKLAYALVDPIAMESEFQLNTKNQDTQNQDIVFVPFKPSVSYCLSILRPAHRPASVISNAFAEAVISKLESIGGRLIS